MNRFDGDNYSQARSQAKRGTRWTIGRCSGPTGNWTYRRQKHEAQTHAKATEIGVMLKQKTEARPKKRERKGEIFIVELFQCDV